MTFLHVFLKWTRPVTNMRSIARIKVELQYYRLLLSDRRTPRPAKIILGLAMGYLAMPFDLIPDFLPVIGHLDDLVIVPALVWIGLRLIPRNLKQELRDRAMGRGNL